MDFPTLPDVELPPLEFPPLPDGVLDGLPPWSPPPAPRPLNPFGGPVEDIPTTGHDWNPNPPHELPALPDWPSELPTWSPSLPESRPAPSGRPGPNRWDQDALDLPPLPDGDFPGSLPPPGVTATGLPQRPVGQQMYDDGLEVFGETSAPAVQSGSHGQGGNVVGLLERIAASLDQLGGQAPGTYGPRPPLGGQLGAGQAGMTPAFVWDAGQEGYPVASPSVNATTRSGLRGAGGYGFGSAANDATNFFEPNKRRPETR